MLSGYTCVNMNWRIMGVILLLILSGCSSLSPNSTLTSSPTSTKVQQTPIASPTPLEGNSDQSIRSYIIKCEKTLIWNRKVVRQDIIGVTYHSISVVIINNSMDEYVVNLTADLTIEYTQPEEEGVGHDYTVRYVGNGSSVIRNKTWGRPVFYGKTGVVPC